MAAFRQLLLRRLLAGRRMAMAPTQAPRAFSTTTGGSQVPQIHQPSLDRVMEEYWRVQNRQLFYPSVFAVLGFISVPVGVLGLGPFGPSKSVMREGKS